MPLMGTNYSALTKADVTLNHIFCVLVTDDLLKSDMK